MAMHHCLMCGGVFERATNFCGGTICQLMVAPTPPSSPTTTQFLIADLADGLRVLNTLYGFGIPEETIQERAKNLAQAILGNYKIERLPDL